MDSAEATSSTDALADSPSAPAPFHDDLFCPECAYNLRGVIGTRCPECGYSLASIRSTRSGIPWIHRKEIGCFRAYWRTVRLVMLRQRVFCEEIARPVSFADSQKFRWLTILHAWAPALLATVILHVCVSKPFGDQMLDGLYAALWPTALLHLCILAYLAAATGMPSCFFHPRFLPVATQNRAVALSYYGCASLAWSFVAVLAATATFLAYSHLRVNLSSSLDVIGAILVGLWTVLFALFLPWWLVLRRIARRTMPQSNWRVAMISIVVPALWLSLGLLLFVAVPLLSLYVGVVIVSLR